MRNAAPLATDSDQEILLDIARAVGLVSDDQGQPSINERWFKNPIAALRGMPATPTGRNHLFQLVSRLTAQPGLPFLNKTWYPLVPSHPDPAGAQLQLCLVRDGDTDVGIGVKGAGASAALSPYVYLPLLAVNSGAFLLDQPGRALELGAALEGSLQTGGVSLDGLKVNLQIDMTLAHPPRGDIQLKNPRLPGGESVPGAQPAADGYVSLFDAVTSAKENLDVWMGVGLDLLTDKLAELYPDEGKAQEVRAMGPNLRALLALPHVGAPNNHFWQKVIAGSASLEDWFLNTLETSESTKAWLEAWFCLLHGRDVTKLPPQPPSPDVSVSGPSDDCFSIPLFRSASGYALDFQLVYENDGTALHLTPGVRLASEPCRLLPAMAVQLQAAVDFASFRVSASGAAAPDPAVFPSFNVKAVLANPYGDPSTNFLFQYTDLADPTNNVCLGAVEIGCTWETGTSALLPFFQFRRLGSGPSAAQDPYDFDAFKGDNGRSLALLASSLLSVYGRYGPDDDTPLADYIRKQQHLQVLDRLVSVVQALLSASNPADVTERIKSLAQNPPGSLAAALPACLAVFTNGLLKDVLGTVPGISCDSMGRMFTFSVSDSLAVSLGTDESGALAIRLQPEICVNALRLGLTAGLSVDAATPASPRFILSAVAGLVPEMLRGLSSPSLQAGPEINGEMTSTGGRYGFDLRFTAAAGSQYQIALWPHFGFYNGSQGSGVDADAWFLGLGKDALLPIVIDAFLGTETVTTLLTTPLLKKISPDSTVTLGQILCDANVLRLQSRYGGPRYRFGNLWSLKPLSLLAAAFTDLLADQAEIPLYTGSSGGDGLYLTRDSGLVGCRLKLANVRTGADRLILQLGSWPSNQTDDRNWLVSSGGPTHNGRAREPGVYLSLLDLSKGNPVFSPCLELVSVGVDFSGGPNKPLFDRNGYRVQSIEPRLYLRLEKRPGDDRPFDVGGAVVLDEIGIPLGPKFPTGASQSNPVAQNLLSSGASAGTGGDGGGQIQAVNPTFSATAAFSTKFFGEIHSDTPSTDGTVWLPINKNFGPLHCRKIGLKLDSASLRLSVDYDGDVALAGLDIDLEDLSIGIPLDTPLELNAYSLALKGLDVSFEGGPVELAGGLFKNGEGTATEYVGLAVVKSQAFTISGVGAYTIIDSTSPSLFVFALLDKDLGGPSWFYVTGLALGFGFNRALVLPALDTLPAYPLVAGACDKTYFAGQTDPHLALQRMDAYIPPTRGSYWLAVGVRFTSFRLIESFALLTVEFGGQTQIALLGKSTLDVKEGELLLAHVEMALLARFDPDAGAISVCAQLTPVSYLFSKSCRLTGGFAFYSWYKDPHEGDFVVTLGGYNPHFLRPDHYPDVPRLGFNWQVSDNICIKGTAYYALTPHAIMAGGALEATWQSGDLSAWFNAQADFLIEWKPFSYYADMNVNIGVRYRLHLLFTTVSLTVSVGVGLEMWGPPFGGAAHIDLSVVSFTISLGPAQRHDPVDWSKFKEAFLPQQPSGPLHLALSGGPGSEPRPVRSSYCYTAIQDGLVKDLSQTGGAIQWVVNRETLVLVTRSVIPSKTGSFLYTTDQDSTAEGPDFTPETFNQQTFRDESRDTAWDWTVDFGVKPLKMPSVGFHSRHTIVIQRIGAAVGTNEFVLTPVLKGSPAALWPADPSGAGIPGAGSVSDVNGDRVLPNALAGFEIRPRVKVGDATCAIDVANLRFENSVVGNVWEAPGSIRQDGLNPADTVAATIVGADGTRGKLLADLVARGLLEDDDVQIIHLSNPSGASFLKAPALARLWSVASRDTHGA